MVGQNKARNGRRGLPIGVCLIYILIALMLFSGVTLSKYVAASYGGDKARVAAIGELAISESGSVSADGKWIVTPGVGTVKKAAIEFGKSEMACYVFLAVLADGWTPDTDNNHRFFYADSGVERASWSVDDGWIFLEENDGKYIYYTALLPNTETSINIIKNEGLIYVSENVKRSELDTLANNMGIKFSAYAVQYDGFGDGLASGYSDADHAAAAWKSLKNK